MSTTMEQSQFQARPRSKSGFSFHSDKSRDTPSKSKHKREESASEKRKTHYDPSTKANPNAAMNEAQPIAAALEKPTLQSLRDFQHTDAAGNPIVDPDLSNPTRSRWERPLDTIRSFEAAIDGEYRRRAQSMRADQTEAGYGSRRSSYYGGGYEQNRYSRASYYGHGPPARDSYADNGYGMGGPVGGPPPHQRMRYGNRMQSDPGWNRSNAHNVYPANGYHHSRDTVNTNGSNGSHSDGPYSNEPSSDNSSIERAVPVKPPPPPQPDLGEKYGLTGFGRGPIIEEYGQGPLNGGPPQQRSFQSGPPPPPPKHATPPVPPKSNNAVRPAVLSKNSDDKRRSWFKRRFSKD